MAKTIGFIGLGVMGEPMCRNLAAKSGATIIAYDQNPAPLARLAGHGVNSASSVAAVGSQADTIFLSLPSGEVVAKVVRGEEGLLSVSRPGQIVVDLSTSPVDLTRQLAKEFGKRDVHFADAPVMRTRAAAEAGTLAIPVGASVEIFNEIRPLIRAFATDISHCGGVGCGQIVKILNNMVLIETVLALSEAHAIGSEAGIDPKVLFHALSTGSADSFALRNHGMNAILPGEFPPRAFSVIYARKDLSYALRLAEETGVDASGARNVDQWFQRAIDLGEGESYFPVISRFLRKAK